MASLFKETGMINRFLLHHVRGRYRSSSSQIYMTSFRGVLGRTLTYFSD